MVTELDFIWSRNEQPNTRSNFGTRLCLSKRLRDVISELDFSKSYGPGNEHLFSPTL